MAQQDNEEKEDRGFYACYRQHACAGINSEDHITM